MRLSALALLLALAAGLRAGGGSPVTWLGGTLPYDTVPHLEADPKLLWTAGGGAPALGAALDAGITDWWMAQGEWAKPADGAASQARALSRLKLLPTDWHGLALAAFAGADLPEGGAARPFAGGILSAETLSSVLVLNVWRSLDGPAREGGSVGLWAPYAWFFLRPGLDAGLSREGGAEARWVLPQLAVNIGGDLSLDLGARFSLDGDGAWRALTRLSYQLFPNP